MFKPTYTSCYCPNAGVPHSEEVVDLCLGVSCYTLSTHLSVIVTFLYHKIYLWGFVQLD